MSTGQINKGIIISLIDDRRKKRRRGNEKDHDDRNEPQHPSVQEDDDSVTSIHETHGSWQGEPDVPWYGCICGVVHERPIPVQWWQCDGPCRAWYNVAVNGTCVADMSGGEWHCPTCHDYLWGSQQQDAVLFSLLDLWRTLPTEVWWRILQFAAPATFRARVLLHQVASLCRITHYTLVTQTAELWNALLQQDYRDPKETMTTRVSSSPSRTTSLRRRRRSSTVTGSQSLKRHNDDSPEEPRNAVVRAHLRMLTRTEDAFHALEELGRDPADRTCRSGLTLNQLKYTWERHSPLSVHRPSPRTGRTLLQVICASHVSEGVAVACVRHALEAWGADPNQYCRGYDETPRPALYFAVARVMPRLVETLLSQGGAYANVTVTGSFRRTFQPARDPLPEGAYTPLELARALYTTERHVVPPYWGHKFRACMEILERASSSSVEKPNHPQTKRANRRMRSNDNR